jgi:hypothetical protein
MLEGDANRILSIPLIQQLCADPTVESKLGDGRVHVFKFFDVAMQEARQLASQMYSPWLCASSGVLAAFLSTQSRSLHQGGLKIAGP